MMSALGPKIGELIWWFRTTIQPSGELVCDVWSVGASGAFIEICTAALQVTVAGRDVARPGPASYFRGSGVCQFTLLQIRLKLLAMYYVSRLDATSTVHGPEICRSRSHRLDPQRLQIRRLHVGQDER